MTCVVLVGLHSSRLTLNSVDSVRTPHLQHPSPDFLDYTAPNLKQALLPHVPDSGVIPGSALGLGQR